MRLSGRVGVVVYAPSAVDKRLNDLSGVASGMANELLLLNFDVCRDALICIVSSPLKNTVFRDILHKFFSRFTDFEFGSKPGEFGLLEQPGGAGTRKGPGPLLSPRGPL